MPLARLSRLQDIDHSRLALTEEARLYLEAGSPEAQVFNAIPESGISLADLKVASVCRFADRFCPWANGLDTRSSAPFRKRALPHPFKQHVWCLVDPPVPTPCHPQTTPGQVKLDGTVGDVGFKQAMQQRWVAISKEGGAPLVMRKVPTIQDAVQTALVAVDRGQVGARRGAQAKGWGARGSRFLPGKGMASV